VKRLESLLNSRTFLVFLPLTILFLWGFFVGPIHGLLNQFVPAGLIGAAIILAIAGLFFLFTLWLIGPHVLPTHPRDRHERSATRRILRHFAIDGATLTAVVPVCRSITHDDLQADNNLMNDAGGCWLIDFLPHLPPPHFARLHRTEGRYRIPRDG
jgi:hypothetical protein